MLEAMQRELDAIKTDPAIRIVVLAGAGNAFSGGVYYIAGSVAWNLVKEFFWMMR